MTAAIPVAVMSGRRTLAPDPLSSDNCSSCASGASPSDASSGMASGGGVWRRLLRVPANGDKRLASSYASFLLGRLLSLCGSISLLVGLLFRFLFLDEDGPAKSVPFAIIGASFLVIVVGVSLVIWSARKSQAARRRHDKQRMMQTTAAVVPGLVASFQASGTASTSSTTSTAATGTARQ